MRRFQLGLLLAVLVGVALRSAHVLSTQGGGWLFDEYFYYVSTATNAYQGKGFTAACSTDHEGVFVPSPGQSWFILAALPFCAYTDANGNLYGMQQLLPKFIQVLLGGMTVLLFGLIGRRLHSPRAGLLAAFGAAVYPGFVHWAAHFMSENSYLFGLALLTWLLLRWIHRPYYRRAILAALVLGLVCFQRGNTLLLAPALAGFCLAVMGWRRGWKPALTFACLPILVLLPWRQFNLKR